MLGWALEVQPKMRLSRALLILASSTLLLAGCGTKQPVEGTVNPEASKFSGTAYQNRGDLFDLIVDVRAARIGKSRDFVPLYVALRSKKNGDLEVNREGLVLATPDGTRLPLVPTREFEADYTRQRIDIRASRDFLDTLNGRFPSPPFRHRPLEFYPLMGTGVVPRDEISLKKGEIASGLIYFRLPTPETLSEVGECSLLMSVAGSEETFVVDLNIYKKGEK